MYSLNHFSERLTPEVVWKGGSFFWFSLVKQQMLLINQQMYAQKECEKHDGSRELVLSYWFHKQLMKEGRKKETWNGKSKSWRNRRREWKQMKMVNTRNKGRTCISLNENETSSMITFVCFLCVQPFQKQIPSISFCLNI